MTCENSEAYKQKQNPYSGSVSPVAPKASPFSQKVSPVSSALVPLSDQCLDYVVENFEDGDFFELQDGSLLTLNLIN